MLFKRINNYKRVNLKFFISLVEQKKIILRVTLG